MKIIDKIFRKRLERIRKELNSYIDFHLQISECRIYTPTMGGSVPEKKRGGVQHKFLNCMEPNDDADIPISTDRAPSFLQMNIGRPELDEVLAGKEESFSEMLLRMIDEKGLKDSDVYKSANIDRRLFSKIRADEEYVPSRKTAISFCLALQLELEEAKKLLATAGYTLSASSRFDLIIMYLIETKEYNIHFANIVLSDYGEGTLSR